MTTDEMAVYIGERLFTKTTLNTRKTWYYQGDGSQGIFTIIESFFVKWLRSPEGYFAMRTAMVKRGFYFEFTYEPEFLGNPNQYCMTYRKNCMAYSAWHDIAEEAIIQSTHKALKAEEDKANDPI